jgi:hypothetical protein
VNAGDLAEWQTGFAFAGGMVADCDFDGDVDGADFVVWQRRLGKSASAIAAAQSVPELSGAAMALTCAASLRLFRSRDGAFRSSRA